MKTAAVVIICVVIVLALLYLLMVMPRMVHRPDRTPFMGVLYAHRGLHDNASEVPENSMAAFQKAVDAGYGIELDVQLSKDKVPVVFHDFTLKRVCGAEGKVADYTYEELQQFSLCGSGQKIPKFEDFLKLVDGRVPLIIEYKIPGGLTEVCPVADKLLQDYKGVYCIESFNPLGLLWYRQNRKKVLRGQLADNFIRSGENEFPKLLYFALHHLLFNFLTKPDFIAYNKTYKSSIGFTLNKTLFGATTFAWTIKSQEQLDDNREDFDYFIFDSFIPKDKSNMEV